MTGAWKTAATVGLAVTGVLAAVEAAGLLDPLERETIDLRFAKGRWRDEPMSDQIRFVDIDDGALESVGRWPWPRATIADALDELRRAGARTVALDVLLEEPQEGGTGDDEALAEALASLRCVLPVRGGDPVHYGGAWRTERGREELDRLLDELGRDIRIAPEEAADRARLTGTRIRRFRARPLEFKKAAAARVLDRLVAEEGDVPAFDRFLAVVAPGIGEYVGDFPERRLLRRQWEQCRAWRALRPLLRAPRDDEGSYRDQAPLPIFAAQARRVGFVDVSRQRAGDGALRTLPLLQVQRGGSSLQFGLAAATLHLDIPADRVRLERERARIGEVGLPLEDARLRLAWPTTATNWLGVLRRHENDRPAAGHVSIAALISLAEQRRTLARNRRHQAGLAVSLLGRDGLSTAELTPALLAEVDGEVDFQSAAVAELIEAGETLSAGERELVAALEQWKLLRDVVGEGEAIIERAAARLEATLRDKLVFVGMIASGAPTDVVPTVLGPATPGVMVHGVVADMALTGRSVTSAPDWTGAALAVLLGLTCTVFAVRLSPVSSVAAVTAVLGGYAAVAGWWAFGAAAVIMPLVAPVATGGCAWIACTAVEAAVLRRERRAITRRFKTRVSPQLVDYLLDNPRAVSVEGVQREVTAMFVDIAGFTALTEARDGPTIVRALNRCLGVLCDCVTAEQGYVNKFLGDGLMAFWSAFREDRQQAARACRSARACQQAIAALHEDPGLADLPALSIRIGIATGPGVVGDCGAPPRLNDYTVIGNAVNLAARLEAANKQFGTNVLIDERTRALLDPSGFRTRPIGRVIVAGQSRPVMVHELLAEDADPVLIEVTREAVEAFLAGDYGASARHWEQLTSRHGPTPLAATYRRLLENPTLLEHGALRLHEK